MLLDVTVLLLFGAASQQNDEMRSTAAEIDAITGSPLDSPFEHAGTDGFHFAKIAFRYPLQCCSNFPRRVIVQVPEPALERPPSVSILINQELQLAYR